MIISRESLKSYGQKWREKGQRVVFTNGCFDLLHLGHIRYLAQARALGDLLVLGLNSDQSVRKLKGPLRPFAPEGERAEVMDALRPVDFVIIFDDLTASPLISELKPDIYVKGGDYSAGEEAGKPLPEAPAVKAYGGEIVLIPFLPGHSTTNLIQNILRAYKG